MASSSSLKEDVDDADPCVAPRRWNAGRDSAPAARDMVRVGMLLAVSDMQRRVDDEYRSLNQRVAGAIYQLDQPAARSGDKAIRRVRMRGKGMRSGKGWASY